MNTMTVKEVNELIRKRRTISPAMYVPNKEIPRAVLEDILENANWAPTHRLTEPWRFKVMTGSQLNKLSEYLGDYYKKNTPAEKFSEMKYSKTLKKPLQCAAAVAICMQRDPKGSVPEVEEIAAVAMAVQNIWLSCVPHGIGSYWSSPKAMYEADEFLGLQEGERCLGVFYMGYYEGEEIKSRRHPIAEKIEWM